MIVRPSIIIYRDNKILLLKYNYNGTDVYGLPGGNPDPGETMKETLVRELKEELNIDIILGELVIAGEVISAENNKTTLHCVFRGVIVSGEPEINSDETTALEVVWKDISDLDKINMYPNVGEQIKVLVQQDEIIRPYIGRIKQQWF